jgi:anhydro-N-acetylmuramic acid kinase
MYHVIGMMSGTSLDGTDLAYCTFTRDHTAWKYTLGPAETFPCPPAWEDRLRHLPGQDAWNFCKTDVDYGHYIGKLIRGFIEKHHLNPGLIASHGHTVFHRPDIGVTCQIGSGAAISAETHLPVVSDFRSLDVALGGQGAPLVPIGDKLLFGDYFYCLNLGGFANISFDDEGKRTAFDICPVNIILNSLAGRLGLRYDQNGDHAREGKVLTGLLNRLDSLDYYAKLPPKSLGREWLTDYFIPLIDQHAATAPVPDLLRTVVEHIARQVAAVIRTKEESILVTGGGAYNEFLLARIQALLPHNRLHRPDPLLVEFKEALVFAFLGVLRIRNEANCLASVTGAGKDNAGGALFGRISRE